jgi:hypothetical protein
VSSLAMLDDVQLFECYKYLSSFCCPIFSE